MLKQLLTWASVVMAVASLAAFRGVMLPNSENCYAIFRHKLNDGGICAAGSCTQGCVQDVLALSTVKFVWCECGGQVDGQDTQESCHAVIRYVGGPLFWWFGSFECVGSCGGDSCYQMAPSDGAGLNTGDKLCGCT